MSGNGAFHARIVGFALAASCLASCAHAEAAALDDLIVFDDPSGCVGSSDLRTLLNDMGKGEDEFTVVPGRLSVPSSHADQFGEISADHEDGWSILTVPVTGSWHGLELVEIRQQYPPGGDPPSNEFIFDASVEEVMQVAQRLGFPASGSEIDSDQEVYTFHFAIEPETGREGATVMSCAWG